MKINKIQKLDDEFLKFPRRENSHQKQGKGENHHFKQTLEKEIKEDEKEPIKEETEFDYEATKVILKKIRSLRR